MSRHSIFLCWFLEEEDTQLKMLQDAGKKNCIKCYFKCIVESSSAVLNLVKCGLV